MGAIVLSPSLPPVVLLPCPRSGDVLLLPAVWPVRLGPAQRRQLAEQLLAYDDETEAEPEGACA